LARFIHAAGKGAEVAIPGFGKFKCRPKLPAPGAIRDRRSGQDSGIQKVVFQPAKL